MKSHLHTKQSASELHQLQGSQSIEEYDTKVEDLMMQLTISQANGNENNHKALQPINEKFAIERFNVGLRNSRLSIIPAAMYYA